MDKGSTGFGGSLQTGAPQSGLGMGSQDGDGTGKGGGWDRGPKGRESTAGGFRELIISHQSQNVEFKGKSNGRRVMGALASRPLSIYSIKGSGLWPNWGLQNFQQGRLGVAIRLEVGARLAIFNLHFPSYIVGLSGGGKSWGDGGSYLTPPHPPREKQHELKGISVVCFMSQGGWTLGSPDPTR